MLPDPTLTVPTLVCSVLSGLASAAVLVMWLVWRKEKRSVRYALVINLTAAEFLNALNNVVSGMWVVTKPRHSLRAGDLCALNGWGGHVTVQAADFSILAIAIVTLMTIEFRPSIMDASHQKKFLICLSVWIVPVINATIALRMGKLLPVSGNWCWISDDPPALRYVLGHGWRFGIFLCTLGIYTCIFWNVRQRLRTRRARDVRTYSFQAGDGSALDLSFAVKKKKRAQTKVKAVGRPESSSSSDADSIPALPTRPPRAAAAKAATLDRRSSTAERLQLRRPRIRVMPSSRLDQDEWHWLLLSLIPLTYMLVWLPGLANRIVEMSGQHWHWLAVLQASTQLTGFVNAIVYGLREHRSSLRGATARRRSHRYSQLI